ncbi:MAG: roadblock/LC7 domain-containing protein [Pseudomonadota bacterium]
MSLENISASLKDLCNESDEINMTMLISSDGFLISHHGSVQDPDLFGAYFLELKMVCAKILAELDYKGIDEIFIRSKSGTVTLLPVFDQAYLACMSSANINAGKIQILAWKYIRKIYEQM